MVISKNDLKNPVDRTIKYDEVRNSEGTLISQKYADNENFDNMKLHDTNEEAMKARLAKKDRYSRRPVVHYK